MILTFLITIKIIGLYLLKLTLNLRQIKAVSFFIENVLINKDLDKEYCESFFEKGSRVCEKLN